MKTKNWILLFVGLAIVCGVSGVLLLRGTPSETAEVWSDGVLVKTIDLSEPQIFRVEYQGGYNVVEVADGKIFVTEASCPDHVCIDHGPAAGGAPIVCLPNRLVIKFQGANDGPDGTVG